MNYDAVMAANDLCAMPLKHLNYGLLPSQEKFKELKG
jgi:hypothetical protein